MHLKSLYNYDNTEITVYIYYWVMRVVKQKQNFNPNIPFSQTNNIMLNKKYVNESVDLSVKNFNARSFFVILWAIYLAYIKANE